MLKRSPLLLIALFVTAASVIASFSFTNTASAVTGADWRAGRITDDIIFTNKDAMSVGEIQSFLNSMVGTGGYDSIPGQCDTNGARNAQPYSSASRAEYARSLGRSDKFTCLSNYYEVPKTAPGPDVPASNYGGAPIPPGAQSAAQLIWNAAQRYNISPKVLLVTIQKESAGPLTTDDWPFQKQYTYAMGAHCPDTGPGGSANCDPNWSGFSLQIDESAALFRWYLDNMSQPWWSYKKPGNNTIQYNPSTGCGSSNVFIENSATAALYTYTPYQPNQAALSNLYGSGDGCSAYGNRNYWRIYSDWFGSTLAPTYSWQLQNQYAYTDSTKTTPIGLGNMTPGQRAYVGITVVNTGNTTWSNTGANPVDLGTTRAYDRGSQFEDGTWLGPSRPARMKEASVAPGQTATFEFWIKAPESYQGSFKEYFAPVAEGKAWMPDIGLFYSIYVQPVRYSWQLQSQYAFTDDTKTTGTSLYGMEPGQRKYIGMTIINTGNTTWSNAGNTPLTLGTTHEMNRSSSLADSTWLNAARPARMKEASVAPGQTATIEFWIKASSTKYGSFAEYFSPLLENKAWLNDIGLNFSGSVVTPSYSWQLVSQYAYSDQTKSTPIGLGSLTPNQQFYLGLVAKNTSNVTWYNSGSNPVDLGTVNPYDRMSQLCSPGWMGCNRPARMQEASVAPGQTATFEFPAKAPQGSGLYTEHFNLVVEGRTWMPNIGLSYSMCVQ